METEISGRECLLSPLPEPRATRSVLISFLGWSKLKLLSGLRRPSHQQRETTGDCGGGGGGGPSVFIARRRGDRLELSRTEPAHWPTAHTLVGEARGRNRGRAFFLGAARFFFVFFWRPCAFFHGVTGGRRRGGAAPACSPYEIAPATRVRRDMGNPIYAVPKSKSEFTHVYIQVRPPRPQPPLGIFPHTGPRSSSSTIAGRRTGRQSRLWTENLTRHETTTATILCARRQNILPDCVSSFSFFLSLATPAA